MEEQIAKGTSVRTIHLAHRRAVRDACGNRTIVASLDAARDEALSRLHQQSSNSRTEDDSRTNMDLAHEIYPRLYLGPFSVARSGDELKRLGITHTICLSAEGPSEPFSNMHYLSLPLVEVHCTLEDGARQLADLVPSCAEFARKALEDDFRSKVLIHCLHGKTRSAAMAACLIAILERLSFGEAYQEVKSCRDVFIPEEWHNDLQKVVQENILPK